MKGKKGLMIDAANNKSIAYSVAKICCERGASLALTFLNDALRRRVEPITEEFGSNSVCELGISDNDHLNSIAEKIKKDLGEIDFIVHAVVYAPEETLESSFLETSKEAFDIAMQTSIYSLLSLTHAVLPILEEKGAILALNYFSGVRYVPHYNVMGVIKAALENSVCYLARDLGIRGIRVNATSVEPIKTLTAGGIGDFRMVLKYNEINSPLKRNISIGDIGNSAMYLLNDLARGATGEVHYVDAGYNIMGMGDVTEDENGNTVLCRDNQKGQ